MFRTALLILSGNAATSLLLLARNLTVAWLIPVADYGVAATFAVAMAVVEMMSALGLQQQIIQAKQGDEPRFQAALQGFQVLRGIAAGAVLFLLAAPMAAFLGIPEAAWAYQVLAVVPVLNAAQHFDVHRLNRQMVFGPLILSKAAPAILSLVALWPLARWFGDWQVMLWAILVQAATGVVASHLVARRPYRLLFDRTIMAQSFRFGWPLLVNGVLMFFVFQGDKLIVGRELGTEALAIFAMGMTLTLTPTLVIAGSIGNFFLPQLVAARGDDPRFHHLAMVVIEAILAVGLLFVSAVVLAGGPVVFALLGEKYASLVPLLVPLAVMQAVRMAKAGPAIVALALGHTGNAMVANLVRMLAIPAGWYVAATSGDLGLIIWVIILGEIASQGTALVLVARRSALSWTDLSLPHLGLACPLLMALVLPLTAGVPDAVVWLAFASLVVSGLWTLRALRRYITEWHRGGPRP